MFPKMDLFQLRTIFNDSIRMSIFSFFKTDNPILDTFITTIAFALISCIGKAIFDAEWSDIWSDIRLIYSIDSIKSLFYKKNTIVIEGHKSSTTKPYTCLPQISVVLSDRCKAAWSHIESNMISNNTVYQIKEFASFTQDEDNYNIINKVGMFIVSQSSPFLFDAQLQIYAIAKLTFDETAINTDNRNNKSDVKTDTISITLYSYHSSIFVIKQYLEQLTHTYLKNIEKQRDGKTFIYTLNKTKYDENQLDCWSERVFDSTKTFNNTFFMNKDVVLKKIQFWLDNKQWYYDKGIPYTLGIGLHGPPGTGKTSFVKSLSHLTKRHIVRFSLKLIKTRRQLMEFFFEDRYNNNNKKNSIGFDKKIIVIEDIDCGTNIVLDRSKHLHKPVATTPSTVTGQSPSNDTNKLLQTIIENNATDNTILSTVMKPALDDDPLSLDDLLDIFDGLDETSNRIIVISSNHYSELDPALIRSGRIDITLKLDNACCQIIGEMYRHLFDKVMDPVILSQIQEYLYSQADIYNIFMESGRDEAKFVERLLLNKSVIQFSK